MSEREDARDCRNCNPLAKSGFSFLQYPPQLLRFRCVGARRVTGGEPGLPLLDCLHAAVATAVRRVHERAVGEPDPPQASARASVLQRTVGNRDGIAWLERAAVDPALQKRRRCRALEAPERLAAVRVLDIQVEP